MSQRPLRRTLGLKGLKRLKLGLKTYATHLTPYFVYQKVMKFEIVCLLPLRYPVVEWCIWSPWRWVGSPWWSRGYPSCRTRSPGGTRPCWPPCSTGLCLLCSPSLGDIFLGSNWKGVSHTFRKMFRPPQTSTSCGLWWTFLTALSANSKILLTRSIIRKLIYEHILR